MILGLVAKLGYDQTLGILLTRAAVSHKQKV